MLPYFRSPPMRPGRVVPRVLLYSVLFLTVAPGIGVRRDSDSQQGGSRLVILTASSLHLGLLRSRYYAILTGNTPNGVSLTWSASLGALPPGLRLDPSHGEITGTPTQGGSFSFTITAADSSGATVLQELQPPDF